MLAIVILIIALLITGYLIYKQYNNAFALFLGGFIMLYGALLINGTIINDPEIFNGQGLTVLLEPFIVTKNIIVDKISGIGLTIMILFGYSAYMNHIGANYAAVNIFTKPMSKIKNPYIIVPVAYFLGNFMSLAIPSASTLAVLLLATMYPIIRKTGISNMTAAAVIATTATIMPTPLGADNILAADLFNMDIMEYLKLNMMLSIPAMVVFAMVHYFWQKRCDKKIAIEKEVEISAKYDGVIASNWYAILAFLPLILVFVFEIFCKSISVDVVTITLISLCIAMIAESLTKRTKFDTSDITVFFNGMGRGFGIVVTLVIAATVLTEGIKALGIINMLMNSVSAVDGAQFVYSMSFAAITTGIGLMSGSGLSVFYSVIELVPDIANSIGANPAAIALPMQLFANLVRSLTPVSAVIIIVSSYIEVDPIDLVKRTAVPALASMATIIVLTFLLF